MADSGTSEQSPLQAWTEFVTRSVGAWPGSAAGLGEKLGAKDDPWAAFIDRLWEGNPYGKLLVEDHTETARMLQQLWLDTVSNPARAWQSYTGLAEGYVQLMKATTDRLLGIAEKSDPVAAPEKGDKRFCGPDWQQNAIFDAIKQAYLLTATSLLKNAADVRGLDPRQRRKLLFYLRQFVDAISPTNFAFTNPEVIHEAVASGGASVVRGTQNLLRDLAAGEIKMTDRDAFQPGRNVAITPGSVVYRNKLMELIQYEPQTPNVASLPLVFVPNWINKYYIVDLQPENSLIRYMVDRGFTVFQISWKNPDASMEDTTFDDYMELGPLTAFRVAREITGVPQVNAVGYCIGGTLLAMTLAYLAAKKETPVKAATFFVSLIDFEEVGDTAVFVDEGTLALVEEEMRQSGYLDSKQMATMFNLLRANDLIWSNVVNNYLLGKEPPAFDLLYWNDDGTRMTRAAHSFYLRNTYVENNLIKPGKIVIKGVPINLKKIRQDIYAVGSEQDHLVPWRTAWRISVLTGGKVRFVIGASGHIAGVINPPAKAKGYWTNDKGAPTAEEWFAGAEQLKGSWWPDWVGWLNSRSGDQIAARSVGTQQYPPITAAPGTYVLEK